MYVVQCHACTCIRNRKMFMCTLYNVMHVHVHVCTYMYVCSVLWYCVTELSAEFCLYCIFCQSRLLYREGL